jgi:hypothetical protein
MRAALQACFKVVSVQQVWAAQARGGLWLFKKTKKNDDDSPHIVQAKFEIVCASDDDQGPAVSFVILVVSLDGPTVQADFGMLIEMKKEFVYLWSLASSN